MRVNVDSQVVTDPRFKKLGRALGMSWHEALGRAVIVWMESYSRREPCLSLDDVDAIAERDNFGVAMVRAELAELVSEDRIRLRGVMQRIEFLIKQAELSKRGVAARTVRTDRVAESEHVSLFGAGSDATARNARRQPNGQPNGQPVGPPNGSPMAEPNGKPIDQPIGSPIGQPYSPDQDQAPDQDQDQRERLSGDLDTGGARSGEGEEPLSGVPSARKEIGEWNPNASAETSRVVQEAIARGVSVISELEQFRDHLRSKIARDQHLGDLDAGWRSWLRRARAADAGGLPAPIASTRPTPSSKPPPPVRISDEDREANRLAAAQLVASLNAKPPPREFAVILDGERAYEESDDVDER